MVISAITFAAIQTATRENPRPSRLKEFDGGIGSIKLSQLTTRSVNDFRDRLRDAGVTVVTTRKILSTLQQLLGYAVNRDMD
jgi:Phage integrase SAM-like domain